MKTIILTICALFGTNVSVFKLDHGSTIKYTSTAIQLESNHVSPKDAVKFLNSRLPFDCTYHVIRVINSSDTLYVKDSDYSGNVTFYTNKRQIKRLSHFFESME